MIRLILMPGLGADARLFEPQRPAFPHLETPPWVTPRPRESLPSFALRMADAIGDTEDCVVGGVSFGGMVAAEIARQRPVRTLVLVASATGGAALPRMNRALARTTTWLPPAYYHAPRVAWPLVLWGFGARTPEARELMKHFLATRSAPFVQWGFDAILRWRSEGPITAPLFHLHGGADRLIPVRGVRPTRVVPGAGHLVNVTHAAEVNAFLADAIEHMASRP